MNIERHSSEQSRKEPLLAQATDFFYTARDIPFRLGLDGNPYKLLSENLGNCARKHFHLGSQLKKLGYKIDLGVAEFDWRDLPIPPEITSLLKNPIDSHLFLYVTTPEGNHITLDATWNPDMPPGFTVNTWNGKDNTPIAVPVIKTYKEKYQRVRTKALAGSFKRSINPNQKPTPFNDAFNHWLGRK